MKTTKFFYLTLRMRKNGSLKTYFYGVGGEKGLSTKFNNARHYNTFLQALQDANYVYTVHFPEQITIHERQV